MSDADNVGSIFVDLKIDDSQLPAAMQRTAARVKSEAARTLPPVPIKIKPQYVVPSSSERAFQLRGSGAPLASQNPYFRKGNLEFDRLLNMAARGEPLDEKSRQAKYKEEERIIRRGRELERREGLKVEREMLREAAQAARQKEQLRTAAEKRVTREATIAAAQQYRAHKEAADKARAEIDKTAKRWTAVKGYVFGGFSIFGKSLSADFTGGLKMAGSLLSGIGNAFLAPWKLLFSLIKSAIPMILVAAGAMATIGGLALRAAAQFERLRARVQGITGSTAMTAEILRQGNQIQSRVPMFSNMDAIEALAMGHSSGMRGKNYADALVNAAATMQTTLTAVSYMITSGRTYQLRRYGITTGSEKGQQYVDYANQSGQNQRLYAQTMEEHRNNILRAINIKFAGAADAASKTFVGTWAGVKNLIGDALREFGEGLLPVGKAIGQTVSDMLNKWVSSGKAKELGVRAGEFLAKAAAGMYATVMVAKDVYGDVVEAFRKAPDVMKEAIIESLKTGALLLGELLVVAIKGTWDFWKSIGSLLATTFSSVFGSWVENSGIPGTGGIKGLRTANMELGFSKIRADHMQMVTKGGLSDQEAGERLFKQFPELRIFKEYTEYNKPEVLRRLAQSSDPVQRKMVTLGDNGYNLTTFGTIQNAEGVMRNFRGTGGERLRYSIIEPMMDRLESASSLKDLQATILQMGELPNELAKAAGEIIQRRSAEIGNNFTKAMGIESGKYAGNFATYYNAGMERINSLRPEIPIKDFQLLMMQALTPMNGLGLGVMGGLGGGKDVISWLLGGGLSSSKNKKEEQEARPEVVHVGFQEMIKKVQEDLFQKKQLDYLKDIVDNTSQIPKMMEGSAFAN